MENKESAKDRFLGTFFGAVNDWDKHIAESIVSAAYPNFNKDVQELLEEQENHGNALNFGLGRETWYSNDYFINCLILDFISDAEGDQDLVDELKLIFVGKTGEWGVDATAINMDMESEGYLIIITYEMELNIQLFSDFVSYHVYAMQIENEYEMDKLLPELQESFLNLIDKEALLKKAQEYAANGFQRDEEVLNSPRVHIASELFEASMQFLLGHEIGHHFLKHTESNGRNIVSKFTPTGVSSNHLDEFAADNFGIYLSIIRGKKEGNKNFLLAPLIVILMLALFDKSPEEPCQTHPSLRDRYLHLLSRVSEINEQVASELQHFFNFVAYWIKSCLPIGYWKTEWWK